MIQIRTANKEDTAAIVALHAQSWRLTYRGVFTDQYLQHELESKLLTNWEKIFDQIEANQYVLVAFNSDTPSQLLGFSCAFGQSESGGGTSVENLHTHPDHKNLGIGRMLLSQVARWSLGHYPEKPIHLWVAAQNAPAIGFYLHLAGVEDMKSFWETPDGKQVPKLRFTWSDPSQLVTEPLNE